MHLRLARLLGPRRWVLAVVATLGVLVAATWAGQALVTARIFAAVVGSAPGDSRGELTPYVVGLVALLVIRPVLVMGREVVATVLMGRVKRDLRDALAVRLTAATAREAGRGRTGHDHAVLVDGVENLDPYLSRYLPQLVVTAVVALGVSVLMALIDPLAGLVVVLSTLVLPFLPRLWDAALARRGADHWEAYQDLHAEFVDSLQGMTTLVTFGAAERRQRELAVASNRLLTRTLRQLRLSLLESGLNGFALAAVPLVALTTVWVRHDVLTPFEAFALVLLSVELVRPLRDLASMWHAGYLGTFSGREITQVLDAESPEPVPGPTQPGPRWELDRVGFTYPGAQAPVLHDITLVVRPGVTGIIGPSGGGKSTVAALLSGLHAPDAGVLRGPGDPRVEVSLVPQDPVLFSGSVRDNIELARPAAAVQSTLSVEEAARIAGIGTDDPTLDLDTQVGERGGLVSGGQRQRIAVARALVQHRGLLILDESTSALDGHSERAVLRRIRHAVRDRPVVVIAHRPGAVEGADRLVRVEDGRLQVTDSLNSVGSGGAR